MVWFLHTFFVVGLKWVMELFLSVTVDILGSAFAAVVALSVLTNLALGPVQRSIASVRGRVWERMDAVRPRVSHIRSTFRGAERQMVLSAYYREAGYSPLSPAVLALPTLVQVPFFLAAYEAVTRSGIFSSSSFLGLFEFGSPDGLLHVGGHVLNVLPLVMTALSVAAALVSCKGRGPRDLVPALVLPVVFLVLLYGAPSGMVLYWTMSQVVSLVRALLAGRVGVRVRRGVLCAVLAASFVWGASGFLSGYALSAALALFACRFLAGGLVAWLMWADGEWERPSLGEVATFLGLSSAFGMLSCVALPLAVVWGNRSDFASGGLDYAGGIVGSAVSALGLFGALIPFLFAFCLPASRRRLRGLVTTALLCALPSAFVIGDYRDDVTYVFDKLIALWQSFYMVALSLFLVVVVAVVVWRLPERVWRSSGWLSAAVVATSVAFLVACMPGLLAMDESAKLVEDNRIVAPDGELRDVVRLSKSKTNSVVLFLDCSTASVVRSVFESDEGLRKTYDGFVLHDNTLSSGEHTVFGSMPIYGGYDYWFDAVQADAETTFSQRVDDSNTLMAKLVSEAGGTASYVSPPLSAGFTWGEDFSAFEGLDGVNVYTKRGLYKGLGDEMYGFYPDVCVEHQLFMVGLTRAAPSFLKTLFFDGGVYGDTEHPYAQMSTYVDEQALVDRLWDVTSVSDGPSHLFVMHSLLTHELSPIDCKTWDFSFDYDFEPMGDLNMDVGEYYDSDENTMVYFADTISFFKRFGRWLDKLREAGVYDNTRIVIVSDHGRLDSFGRRAGELRLDGLNPTVMVKEPKARGFEFSDKLMTSADTPALALAGIVDAPVNPVTGNAVDMSGKSSPLTVTTSDDYNPSDHAGNVFDVSDDEVWTFSGNDIDDEAAWSPGFAKGGEGR